MISEGYLQAKLTNYKFFRALCYKKLKASN